MTSLLAALLETKLLTDLIKVYNDDDKKYSGKKYDVLDTKLQIFYNCCLKISLPNTLYNKAFSIMLRGRASDFYYAEISGRDLKWEVIKYLTKL